MKAPASSNGASPTHGQSLAMTVTTALQRSARNLLNRVDVLEARLDSGDETTWSSYTETVRALAALAPLLAPGASGEMLTTQEMAARLGVSPKTLLRHRKNGGVRPAFARGKLLRWHGADTP